MLSKHKFIRVYKYYCWIPGFLYFTSFDSASHKTAKTCLLTDSDFSTKIDMDNQNYEKKIY